MPSSRHPSARVDQGLGPPNTLPLLHVPTPSTKTLFTQCEYLLVTKVGYTGIGICNTRNLVPEKSRRGSGGIQQGAHPGGKLLRRKRLLDEDVALVHQTPPDDDVGCVARHVKHPDF